MDSLLSFIVNIYIVVYIESFFIHLLDRKFITNYFHAILWYKVFLYKNKYVLTIIRFKVFTYV